MPPGVRLRPAHSGKERHTHGRSRSRSPKKVSVSDMLLQQLRMNGVLQRCLTSKQFQFDSVTLTAVTKHASNQTLGQCFDMGQRTAITRKHWAHASSAWQEPTGVNADAVCMCVALAEPPSRHRLYPWDERTVQCEELFGHSYQLDGKTMQQTCAYTVVSTLICCVTCCGNSVRNCYHALHCFFFL